MRLRTRQQDPTSQQTPSIKHRLLSRFTTTQRGPTGREAGWQIQSPRRRPTGEFTNGETADTRSTYANLTFTRDSHQPARTTRKKPTRRATTIPPSSPTGRPKAIGVQGFMKSRAAWRAGRRVWEPGRISSEEC